MDDNTQRSLGRLEGKMDIALERLAALESKEYVCINVRRLEAAEISIEKLKTAENGRSGVRAFVTLVISVLAVVTGIGSLVYTIKKSSAAPQAQHGN